MHRLTGFMMGMVIFLFLFTLNTETFAAPNVKDCMEGNTDCEKLDTDTPEKKNSDDNAAKNGTQKQSFAIDMIKMVFALVIVIGLIYILLKFLNKRNKLFSTVKTMENLGGISVGTNKSLQLVRISTSIYVIGVGDNVDMLQEITDEQVKRELLNQNEGNTSGNGMLAALFSGNKKTADTEKTDFKERLSQELIHLKKTRQQIIRQSNEKDEKDD